MDKSTTYPELERLLTHQDWLRALARKLVGDSQAAEDLVQETWMAAMKSPPIRRALPGLGWRGVVRRLASMRARGEGRRARRQNAVAVADLLPSTADLVEEVDTQRRLVSEVIKLSEPYRTTVMLRYFNNLSSAEIARHQGVPAGTVRWRLKRGLDELRERLDDSFGSREDWCIALLPMAKMGWTAGAGVASSGSGALTLASTAWAAKWVAGLLAMLGLVYVSPLLGTRLRHVFAGSNHAELLSLEPELDGQADASAGGPKVAVVSRGLVMPEERQVRFLEPNREPIVGMRVVLDDGSPTLPVATTNARGEVTFSTTLQKGTLYARRDNSFLQRLEVNLVAARVDAILPWNAELTGRVLAGSGDQAGSLAMPDLQLRVDSDVQLWGGEAVPQTVLAHFEHPNYVQVTSDAEGFFRVQNLPQEWSGKLWLPEGVAVQGASRRDEAGRYVYFREPSHHAMVLVQRLPRLVGRLVGLDGLGSPQAQVRCWVDGATDPLVAVTGPAGGFELLLDSDGHLGLRLEAVSADGLQQADLAFAGNEIPSGFALGDVVLASTLRLGFRAIDPKGDPIFGARGLYQGQLLHGTPTDDEGWGEAILPPAAQDCWIVAPGFQPKEISLGGALEKRTVDLLPATELTLQVLDADTLSMPGATLRVSCGERLFAYGEPFQPASLDLQAMTGTFVATGQGRDLPYAEFRANDQGQLRLLGVVAGAPLWVEVVDKLGMPLHQHRVAALSPSEQRTEQVLVPRKLREFHGIVRDRADNVLVGVQVDLVDSEGKQVSAVSGLDGYVHFQDLSGDHYAVRIDKRGFVAQEIPDFALSGRMGSSPETPAAFVLERGADVAVLVVDGDDRPVLGGRVSARRLSDDQAYLAAPEGAADQTLQDLDQGAIELTLKLGGVVYTEVMQAPLERSIEFRVPAHGALEVVWTLPSGLGLDVPLRLRATALGPNGEPLEAREPVLLTIGARTGTSGVSRFEALLPGNYAIDLLQPTAPVESIQGEAQAPATWSPMVGTQTCQIVLGDAVRKNLDASGALRQ